MFQIKTILQVISPLPKDKYEETYSVQLPFQVCSLYITNFGLLKRVKDVFLDLHLKCAFWCRV